MCTTVITEGSNIQFFIIIIVVVVVVVVIYTHDAQNIVYW